MNLVQLFIEAWTSISAHRLRSSLSILGIVIGILSITLMNAIGNGVKGLVDDQLEILGNNLLLVAPNPRAQMATRGAGRDELTLADVTAIAQGSFIRKIAPVLQIQSQVEFIGEGTSTTLLGTSESMFDIRGWQPFRGMFFTAEDVLTKARVVVIGPRLAEFLFFQKDPLNKYLRISGVPFLVIGVLNTKGKSFDGTELGDIVLMPHSTMSADFPSRGKLGMIHYAVAQALDSHSLARAQESIEDIIRVEYRLGEFDEVPFRVSNLANILESANTITSALTFMFAVIGGISLIIGGVGIMNIMLVSVTERTREIGVRLALGATQRDILVQFLIESVVICLVGAFIGSLLSVLLAALISEAAGHPIAIGWAGFLISNSFAASVGLAFGFYPARLASKLMPSACLRSV